MARKITTAAIEALMSDRPFNRDNTIVETGIHPDIGQVTTLKLHGNAIAQKTKEGVKVCNAGWFSVTTKERLNGIPGVSVYQRKGEWFLNGQKWNGDWTQVER